MSLERLEGSDPELSQQAGRSTAFIPHVTPARRNLQESALING